METDSTTGQAKFSLEFEPSSFTILIADDDRINLTMLSTILGEFGYRIHPVGNGREALAQTELLHPDLILLDVMMPGLSGFELCVQLKSREATRAIPIIFVTCLQDEKHEGEGFALGAVDFIRKPFSPITVLARVKTHLELKQHRDYLEKLLRERTEKLSKVKAEMKILSGLLPICAACKKIRDDHGYWNKLESYIERHSEAAFTHGICEQCAQARNPELYGEPYAEESR